MPRLIALHRIKKDQSGFTLLELLTSCAIVSLLCAICIQVFAEYKRRAFDSQAETALRNAMTAEEALFVDSESYADCVDATCENVLPGFRLSPRVNISIVTRSGAAAYDGTSSHPSGGHTFEFDSDLGSLSSS